jgi:hypothetical protein
MELFIYARLFFVCATGHSRLICTAFPAPITNLNAQPTRKRSAAPQVSCRHTPSSRFGKAFGESFVLPVLIASLGIKDRP